MYIMCTLLLRNEEEKMSFIPAKCPECGGTLRRMSNENPILVCVNNDCKREFELLEKS